MISSQSSHPLLIVNVICSLPKQLQPYPLLVLEPVEVPPQHLLHFHHHLLSIRKVHWFLFTVIHI